MIPVKSLSLLVGSWLSVVSVFAQPVTLSPEQAREDIRVLKYKLDQLHPGLGFYTPRPRMERLYDSLYNRLTTSIDYLSFYQHLSPLVANLKDGHTNVNHRRGFMGKHMRYVPFYIRQVGSDYFISHNMSADTSFRRGTKLLTINGRSVADLHRELMETDRAGSDGDNLTGRRQWSIHQFADYYAAWYGSADSLTFTYQKPGSLTTQQTLLACPTLTEFRLAFQARYEHEADHRPNLSVRVIDTLTHTAVLRVSTFMSPKRRDPFQLAFNRRLKRAFRTIRQQGIENLVVDLQNNGGGVVLNSARLLQYWLPERFTIMQQEQLKRAARSELIVRWNPFSTLQFNVQYKADGKGGFASRAYRRRFRPRQRTAFRGNLYFLMNGASFSAATSVLAKTLDANLGTFVGEACGGAYWGDFAGHFKTITLPNSRIQVRIPLKKLTHAVTSNHANGFTVEPDFAVNRSYADLLQNRDHALQHALQLIQEGLVARKPLPARITTTLQALR